MGELARAIGGGIGAVPPDTLERDVETKANRIADLESENEQLRERLAAVEDQLAGLDTSSTSADD